jgi:hypothetical protein
VIPTRFHAMHLPRLPGDPIGWFPTLAIKQRRVLTSRGSFNLEDMPRLGRYDAAGTLWRQIRPPVPHFNRGVSAMNFSIGELWGEVGNK